MKIKALVFGGLLTAALCLGAGGALAGTTVGVGNTGNCYPFNCNDSGTSSGQSIDYEQIYASSAFSGITDFGQISFSGLTGAPPSLVISGNYEIEFATTTDPLGSGLPLSLSNEQVFFDGSLPAGSGTGVYTIDGTPYDYNPADGNLVMIVIATNQANVPNNSGNGYFNADNTGTVTSRAYLITGGSNIADSIGLVTTFGTPEPATWTLMLAGIGGLGLALRSRRRLATA